MIGLFSANNYRSFGLHIGFESVSGHERARRTVETGGAPNDREFGEDRIRRLSVLLQSFRNEECQDKEYPSRFFRQ